MSGITPDREKELREVFSRAMSKIMSDFYKKTLDENLRLFIHNNIGELYEDDMRYCIEMLIEQYNKVWLEMTNIIIHVKKIDNANVSITTEPSKGVKTKTAELIDFSEWKGKKK